jgi:pyridoxal kinase
MSEGERTSTVLVVSSQVARGAIGARASGFALERLGHTVWLVPTVWLPWHPGHGVVGRIAPDPTQFTEALAEIAESPRAAEIETVLTGYFADAAQVEATARLVERLRLVTPGLRLVVDPVLGDGDAVGRGRLYVGEAIARAVRDRLLPLADVATPNRFELSWLAGTPVGSTAEAVVAARRLPAPVVVVTSAPALMTRSIGTLLVSADAAVQFEHPLIPSAAHGTGDLFAGLLVARLAAGLTTEAAVAKATASVFQMVARTARAGADELILAAEQDVLVHPMAEVSARRIGETGARRSLARPTRPGPSAMTRPPSRFAGIDGCPAGWIVCLVGAEGPLVPEIRIVARLADLFSGSDAPGLAVIDMPIGLPERIGPGGRGPERLVRPLLGERQSSVFSIPSRAAIFAGEGLDDRDGYGAACAAALATSQPPKKVSKQAFHLFPKIREVDRLMTAASPPRLFEAHPEVAFAVLNGGRAMALPKKVKSRANPAGLDERRALLVGLGFEAAVLAAPPRGAGPDDLLDACVLALTARRIAAGTAAVFPDPPLRDGRGVEIAIRA